MAMLTCSTMTVGFGSLLSKTHHSLKPLISPPSMQKIKHLSTKNSLHSSLATATSFYIHPLPSNLASPRFYSIKPSDYFNKYIPPTGVLTEEENEEPWDATRRPKRKLTQLGRRIEKLIRENDYYTIFAQEEQVPVTKPPLKIPDARNGMNVETFLKTIGRGCEEYIDKFENWGSLFEKRRALKQFGIPTRQRKWILLWTERYRQGFDPWYVPFRSKSKRNTYDNLEWRKKLVTQKKLRTEWGLD